MEASPFRPADAPAPAISLRLAPVPDARDCSSRRRGLACGTATPPAAPPGPSPPSASPPESHGLEWDATAPDGRWSAVTTVPGSSLCSLLLMDPAGDLSTRNLRKPREVLRRPRFVRGHDRLLTAIDENQPQAILVMGRDAAGLSVRSLPSPTPDAYRVAALIVESGSERTLLFTAQVKDTIHAGPQGTLPHRTLWGFTSELPGRLFGQRLDEEFRPRGSVERPLGDALVYEFDADGIGEGRLALLATTSDGFIFAMGRLGDGPFDRTVGAGRDLVSPAILRDGDEVRLAAIEGGSRRALLGAAR